MCPWAEEKHLGCVHVLHASIVFIILDAERKVLFIVYENDEACISVASQDDCTDFIQIVNPLVA